MADNRTKDPATAAAEAQAERDAAAAGDAPELTVAQKVDAAANAVDNTSTPAVPGQGVPPLATEPIGTQAADVVGEEPGDDWTQVVFKGAGPSGDWKHIPAPASTPDGTDQQIDQVGPSGRSYHFRQNVVSLVHPDDADYFLKHEALHFEAPAKDQAIS